MGYGEEALTLSQVLPKPTRDRLETLVKASGGSMEALEHQEPWAVSMGLVLGVSQGWAFRADLGLDRHLMARGSGRQTCRRARDHRRSADAGDGCRCRARSRSSLDDFVRDPRKAVRQLDDMHAWWRDGDVAKLDGEDARRDGRKTPASYRLLDVRRNQAWLPPGGGRLDAPAGQDTLVVVGSLHLLGSDGLVEQLRATGRYDRADLRRLRRGAGALSAQAVAGTATMQSTGHAGRLGRMPVHGGSTTTCTKRRRR